MPVNEWSDSIFILDLADEPAFSEEMDAINARLDEADTPTPHVVVNLAAVRFVSSSNLAQLLRLRKRVLSASRQIHLAAVQDSVWSVLLTTGLDLVFTFSPDVATALASVQMSGSSASSAPRRPATSPTSQRTNQPPRH
ncbi:MAG TPA: STAS domain-containing protein [Phycisphaerales bacterium]|nr:STAS domain-containing protein [Phycisphaerales bacterium]